MQVDSLDSLGNVVVFIAGPYSAPTNAGIEKNIRVAEKVALALAKAEIFFICPHLNSAHFDSKIQTSDSYYYKLYLKILERTADVILVLPGYQRSTGTLNEIKAARQADKLVYFINGDPEKTDWLGDFINWLKTKLTAQAVASSF